MYLYRQKLTEPGLTAFVDGLFLYFKNLAKVLSGKKIFIHNIPSRSGVNISFSTLKKLLKSQKNIVGLS